jgi:hypothetical protein
MWVVYLLLCALVAAELVWRPRLDWNFQTGDLLLWHNIPDGGRTFKKLI